MQALGGGSHPCTAGALTSLELCLAFAQADPDRDPGDLAARYPKAQIRDFDGNPEKLTEMDALIAYLQMLGTLVDFDSAAPLEELAEEKGR